jgi:predicted RNA polymerase sigma factor
MPVLVDSSLWVHQFRKSGEARSAFTVAATLTRNARERTFLLGRADACDGRNGNEEIH